MGKLDETDQIKKLSDELSKLRDTYAGELRQRAWLVSERDRAQAQQANAQRQLDTHMAQVEAAECRAPEHGFEQADIVRAQWQQRAVAAEEVCDRWGTRVRELEGERDAARACYDALCVGLLAAYEDDAGFGDTVQALIDGLSEQTMDWADAAALSRTRAEAAEARAEMWRERTIAAAEEKRDELADAVCAPLKWDEWSAALFAEPVNTTLDETPLAEQKDARGDHWRARALAAEATVVAAQAAAIQWEARARAAESAEFSNADQLYEAAAWQERALAAEAAVTPSEAARDRDVWRGRARNAVAERDALTKEKDALVKYIKALAVVEESRANPSAIDAAAAVYECDGPWGEWLPTSDSASARIAGCLNSMTRERDAWKERAEKAEATAPAARAAWAEAELEAQLRLCAAQCARAEKAEAERDKLVEEKAALVEYLKARTLERDEWRERALAAEATVVSEQADAIQWKVRALAAESAEAEYAEAERRDETRSLREPLELSEAETRAKRTEADADLLRAWRDAWRERALHLDDARDDADAAVLGAAVLVIKPIVAGVTAPAWTDTEAATARITGCDPRTGEPLSTAEEDDARSLVLQAELDAMTADRDSWRARQASAEYVKAVEMVAFWERYVDRTTPSSAPAVAAVAQPDDDDDDNRPPVPWSDLDAMTRGLTEMTLQRNDWRKQAADAQSCARHATLSIIERIGAAGPESLKNALARLLADVDMARASEVRAIAALHDGLDAMTQKRDELRDELEYVRKDRDALRERIRTATTALTGGAQIATLAFDRDHWKDQRDIEYDLAREAEQGLIAMRALRDSWRARAETAEARAKEAEARANAAGSAVTDVRETVDRTISDITDVALPLK